jgi:hypothetical protein
VPTVVGVAVVALALAGVALFVDSVAVGTWIALLLAVVLMVASVPVFRWIGRRYDDPWLTKVLMWALPVALLFGAFRYVFTFVLYGGGDATIYDEAGRTFVEHLRQGVALHPIDVIEPYPVQTQRVGDVTGILYTLTWPSIHVGFVLFSYMAFIGKVLMVLAFKVAVPEGDHRRYALLVLFFPSLLFWPASIGKEAILMAALGVTVYGAALLLAPRVRPIGGLYFAVGSGLALLIRPHVALMSIAAFGVAILLAALGPSGQRGQSARTRALRLSALVLVIVLGVVGSARLSAQFESIAEEGTESALTGALQQSSTGESQFEPTAVSSPLEVPIGVFTVLLRPLPFEATSAAELVSSLEGVLLLSVLFVSWRRVLSFPRLALRRPFLAFSASYVVLFTVAFSFIANFGILSRQRVLVLPAVLVLAALPIRSGKGPQVSASRRLGQPAELSASGGPREELLPD